MEWLSNVASNIGMVRSIAGVLGISVLGLFGVIIGLRKCTIEIVEAVTVVKKMFKKYENKFNSDPEIKKDYKKVKREVDEALEAVANLMSKVPFFKKYAKKLRDVIN